MKLEEVQAEWEKDCPIDQAGLGDEAARCPRLHSKYANLLVQAKFNSKRSQNKVAELVGIKTRYYNGLMTREELASRGWHQYQGKRPLKTELNDLIQSDEDYIKLSNIEFHHKTTIEFLESVMKELNNRNFHIKSVQEWLKWTNGTI